MRQRATDLLANLRARIAAEYASGNGRKNRAKPAKTSALLPRLGMARGDMADFMAQH